MKYLLLLVLASCIPEVPLAEPKFAYEDCVIVTEGFYKGQVGYVYEFSRYSEGIAYTLNWKNAHPIRESRLALWHPETNGLCYKHE